MANSKIVIVGASVAGIRTAQALRAGGFDGDLVVVGDEQVQPYDRPPLSKEVLLGSRGGDNIGLLGPEGWGADGITPLLGRAAAGLKVATRELILADGERVPYDELVIATGASARVLRRPDGTIAAGSIRTLADAERIRSQLLGGGPVVVVGGGFLGGEVAASARQLGCEVTIVEAHQCLLATVLGPEVGRQLAGLHSEHQVNIRVGVGVEAVDQVSRDTSVVRLADGSELEAATVIAGIGAVANDGWLQGSGLQLDRGVITDGNCRAIGADHIWAAGDVARWSDRATGTLQRLEHWTNAVDQAGLVAHNILNPTAQRAYQPAPYFWSDQHGCKIQMIGLADPRAQVTLQSFGDKPVALFGSDRLLAAVTFSWPRAMAALRRLWTRKATVAEAYDELQRLGSPKPQQIEKGTLV